MTNDTDDNEWTPRSELEYQIAYHHDASARETGRCGISQHCRLDQENTRLRTALKQIAACQPTEPADDPPCNFDKDYSVALDQAFDAGIAYGNWLCGEIARAALQR